jgi:hypothetical protein
MMPALAPAQLKRLHAWEYLVRFAFGGVITAATALIGHAWGPAVAGLFLAFPAILPASLTLVKQHDGRARAADDASGARLGAISLACFALVIVATAGRWPPSLVLLLAAAVWFAVAAGLWFTVYRRSRA